MVDTKIKGVTTELLCQAYLTSLGYNISVPIGEDCRYDMILDVEGKLFKIQTKACREEDNTRIVFSTCSITTSGKENIKHSYTKNEIDFIATYYNNQCYLIPIEECENGTKRSLSFSPKQLNASKVLYIDDYTAEKIISNILNKEINLKNDLFTNKNIISNYTILCQYDLNNNLINTYYSYLSAAKAIGKEAGSSHISQCARGLRNTAYGYIWKWKDNKAG